MKYILGLVLAATMLGCAPGTNTAGGFYYTTGQDTGSGGQDAVGSGSGDTLTNSGSLNFGQLQGSWDVLFANWGIASGTAKFAGKTADLALVGTDQGQPLYSWGYENCKVAVHTFDVHLEIATDTLILCSLTEKYARTGDCPQTDNDSYTINFTFKRDAPGTSQFGVAAGGWHIEWPVSTSKSSVQCSFSLANGLSQGCGNAEFQFSSSLVGNIMNGKIDEKATFSAQRQ